MAKKDVDGVSQLLIDAELKMFYGLNMLVIFLRNVVTDLLLGLGFYGALEYFSDYVKQKHHGQS